MTSRASKLLHPWVASDLEGSRSILFKLRLLYSSMAYRYLRPSVSRLTLRCVRFNYILRSDCPTNDFGSKTQFSLLHSCEASTSPPFHAKANLRRTINTMLISRRMSSHALPTLFDKPFRAPRRLMSHIMAQNCFTSSAPARPITVWVIYSLHQG